MLAQTLSSARVALRDTYMRQLSTVGLHSLTGEHAGEPSIPHGVRIFTLPATRTNASVLLGSATAMVGPATPYASIPTAGVISLEAVTASMQGAASSGECAGEREAHREGATQGIVAQIKAGRGTLRMMDVVIGPLLAPNTALFAQWESAKRSAGGSNLKTPVPVPGAAATTTAPAATSASSGTTGSSTPSTPSTSPSTPSAITPQGTTYDRTPPTGGPFDY